jgi:hypothetical protein
MTKNTKDNKQVPDRIWYYLLDWNERDEWETIWSRFGVNKLHECTKEQIISLFDTASRSDYSLMQDTK